MTNIKDGMYEYEPCDKSVHIGDGSTMTIVGIGKLDICVQDANGRYQKVTLLDVHHVPGLTCNLLSMNNILKQGFNVKYESEHMYLSSKNIEI